MSAATTVTSLAVTAIKGTRLRNVGSIELSADGAVGDRRFFIIDARDRMLNGKQLGTLQGVVASFDPASDVLELEFPDGTSVAGTVQTAGPVTARFYSSELAGTLVRGPWADALSEHLGRELRLVQTVSAVDRGAKGAASLISRASLIRLANEAKVEMIDARRFRMLIEVDGLSAHAEDAWIGRTFELGAARVQFEGHVGRCLVTSRNPDSGDVDLPTLDLLRAYRGAEPSTEPLPFGIYGRVLRPGAVTIGDPVRPATLDKTHNF